jgi:hypothetical protein
MRHGFLSLLPCAALVLISAPSSTTAQRASAAEVAVQYVQVSTHTAMTMNGQTISNGAQAQKMMGQMAAKGMMAGMVQSLVGSAIQSVLSTVNPILGLAAQLVASKVQQKIAEAAAQMKMGVAQVQSEAVTTTVAALRRRIDDAQITVLVQCDLGRLVVVDNAAHTYSVKTFDELAAEGAAAVATDSSGKDTQSANCKTPAATVEHSSDDQTETIADMTAHHKTDTATYTFPPSCMPKADQSTANEINNMKWTTERWYATTDIPNQCSLPVAGNERDTQAAATVEIPLRIVRKADISKLQSDLAEKLKAMPPNPMMEKSGVLDIITHIQDFVTFTTETQSVKQIPYDPSSFDIPAGYSQTESGPTPPPALRQSS